MYSKKMEDLIKAALADNKLTPKEEQILFKRAEEEGIDPEEFEMVLNARLVEKQKEEQAQNAKQEKPGKSAQQTTKYGDIRKCPACGSLVGAFKGSCSECGYEFANVAPNQSSQKLYDALIAANSYAKKIEIIETFPIPITKSDLLEFLTALKPRITDTDDRELQQAYFKKYSECIEKVRVSFAGDKQLQPFVDGYGDLVKCHKRKKATEGLKEMLLHICLFLFKYWYIAVLLAIYGISKLTTDIKEESKGRAIAEQMPVFETYIKEGSADEAKSVLEAMGPIDYHAAYKLLQLYVAQDDVENAIDVYENLIPNSRNKSELSANSLLINALIKSGDYDRAWVYYPKKYTTATYAGNAQSYYQFMTDVITYLCKKNARVAARNFITEYSIWFDKYVDNGEWGKKYMDYSYDKSKAKLMQLLNRL